MNAAGIAIGLNYEGTDKRLHGCKNDADRVSKYLRSSGFKSVETVYESDGLDLVQDLNNLAFRSWRQSLDLAWIHFCGHGKFEEINGESVECLVPSDFKTRGLVSSEYIRRTLGHFHPETSVIGVFDCCYPPSLLAEIRSPRILIINGCAPGMKASDRLFIRKSKESKGVLTTNLIDYLETRDLRKVTILDMIDTIRSNIKKSGCTQVPQLYSNFEITKETKLI